MPISSRVHTQLLTCKGDVMGRVTAKMICGQCGSELSKPGALVCSVTYPAYIELSVRPFYREVVVCDSEDMHTLVECSQCGGVLPAGYEVDFE